jgi:hypothetical protein
MAQPLMPKATAVWLIDNTSLSFEQIGEFCGLHALEVKGIADGEVAQGIKGLDPVSAGQLTRNDIEKAQEDSSIKLKLVESTHEIPERTQRRGPRYTPLSRRQDKPDAIYWMIRNHPEISDAQVAKLIGTTKPTINAIRDRTHWNATNLKPVDPVSLALCSQIELDEVVQKAAVKKARADARTRKAAEKAGTIKPTEETLSAETAEEAPKEESNLITPDEMRSAPEPVFAPTLDAHKKEEVAEEKYDAASVFAGLNKKIAEQSDED